MAFAPSSHQPKDAPKSSKSATRSQQTMSATKRRAGNAASPELSTPDPKRQRKRNDDTFFPDIETVKTTKELGSKIVSLLKRSVDKNGRLISTNFLDLPDRDEYPDYYTTIAMPLSLNIIEEKLNNGSYSTMEMLESDLKRMVQNAKDYNSSKSSVFEDAERIRKALSNFMPKHNPAYLDKDYRAYPTPIPQAMLDRMNNSPTSTETPSEKPSIRLKFGTKNRRQSQAASADGAGEQADGREQMEAQQLELLDEISSQENAINFEEKVSRREIPHYYKVIAKPTSISDVRAMVNKGSLADWEHFAAEVRLIWGNAKEYNEPGSEIYEMAEELDAFTEEKLQDHGVAPKVSTKIKLTQKPKQQIKLKVGSSTPTPNIPGTSVDSEALRRQKEEMTQALSRVTREASRGYTNGSTPVPAAPSNLRRSISVSESNTTQDQHTIPTAPAVTPVVTLSDGAKPEVPISGPHNMPSAAINLDQPPPVQPGVLVNGNHPVVPYQPPKYLHTESDNPIERKYRDSGKGLQDALLSSVTYMTHPNLPDDPKWKLTRHASSTQTQTSHYIFLPHTHYYLRVIPGLTTEYASRRTRKMVVTHNWQTIHSSTLPTADRGDQIFEFRLSPGENTIAVDVIADLKHGEKKEYAPAQLQIDFERITLFAYLKDREELTAHT